MIVWIVETLAASALLMLIVLAARGVVARAFGPTVGYALWALPALRLLLPPLPGAHRALLPAVAPMPHEAVVIATVPTFPAAPPVVAVETVDWTTLLLVVWLGGALLWFGWQMLRYRHFLDAVLADSVPLGWTCGIEVLRTPAIDGPVAAGIVSRRILLPADFMERYGADERRLALLHEGAHHDRRDILANLAALAVLALHWWNPIAHRAYRAFRADQELACDATVLADLATHDRHAYGSAIVKSVSRTMPGVACALGHKAALKARLRGMKRPAVGTRRMWTGIGVALAATGAGLFATASGQASIGRLDHDEMAMIRAAEDDRREALREIAQARRDVAMAHREAARAAEETARETAAGYREAQRAAADAKREALRARVAAQSLASGALAEATARAEAARDRALGQSEAARGWAEAARERAEGLAEGDRERALARIEASRERAAARAEAARERAEWAGSGAESARQIALTRQRMADRCAARGRPVSPDLDWSRLALCGDTGASIAARVTAQVQRSLARAE